MPNKTIYLSTIKDFEKSVGFSVINQEEVAEKLQKAWKKDTTQAKVDYLVAYGEVFRDVLKKWSDSEFLHAFCMWGRILQRIQVRSHRMLRIHWEYR